MNTEIIVVTAAYGQQQVAALGGQQALLPLIQQAGADGVEIRRELFDAATLDSLPALAQAIQQHQLRASYSVPDTLFCDDGALNPQLENYLKEARQLSAQRLKLALGGFSGELHGATLRALSESYPVELAVENDQTAQGKLAPSLQFFHAAEQENLPVVMTFDMGNWLWTQENALDAAARLGRFVRYIHVKAAVPHGDSFRAIALDDASDDWRQLLQQLPVDAPRGIEFPLEGEDLLAVTRHYVTLLRNL
ncbi:sugar phosphate isomerase/epimerase [Candidatus Pantoea deserta]|uniref:Sugar phosphate isomerase/epimerase n=1 Tax=Candidatus Pantoea deserta TaxID=1869313 RepID=A0A3N4NMI0_9GAMM|nr:sugar phosphate isomerase/epimerase [Pantoea deserta]RPD97592.1 sugar phosphate isomerase/epimerase [Pantoea deserta]